MKWFLSSTYEDLREHGEKAAQAIERLEQRSVRMEAFGARPGEAGSVSGDEVRSSEGFIGIYAHRYGYIPKDSDISITEMEFKIAKEANIPTLCFLINEDFPWSPKYIEKEPGQSKLKSFKDDISTKIIRDIFTTPDDLGYKVASSLGRFLVTQKVKSELDKSPSPVPSSKTEAARDQVSRRAARLQTLIRGANILLVNDIPSEMSSVISIFKQLGIETTISTSTGDALSCVKSKKFDVIISDMRRGDSADEGIVFLGKLREATQVGTRRPVIFTVGQYDPKRGVPAYAFGITNRVDELLNLVFDALERVCG